MLNGLAVRIAGGSVLCAFVLCSWCHAQGYPVRAVRLIVPAPPGGGTDILGRVLAVRLGEALGQQVVVDNRAGGGGIIGSDLVARAPADGYTLLMAFTSHVTNPSLVPKMPYDTLNDFAPVSLVAIIPSIVVVHPSLPVTSLAELVRLAKSRPGQLAYSSAGNGSASHLAVELFAAMSGARLVHVPYKGSTPALADLIAGQVSLMMGVIPSTEPHVRSGRLRALAVTSAQRSAIVPDLPTVAEAGLPGFESTAWFAVLAPARTPEAVIARLNGEIRRLLQLTDVREKLQGQGAELQPGTPADLDRRIRLELDKWAKIIKASGAKVD